MSSTPPSASPNELPAATSPAHAPDQSDPPQATSQPHRTPTGLSSNASPRTSSRTGPARATNPTPHSSPQWIYIGRVNYVTGGEADELRTEIATAIRDLLVWANTNTTSRGEHAA